jgi:hypothetical protein
MGAARRAGIRFVLHEYARDPNVRLTDARVHEIPSRA